MSTTEAAFLVTAFLALFAWLGWHATAPVKDASKMLELVNEKQALARRNAWLENENTSLKHQLEKAKTARRKRK